MSDVQNVIALTSGPLQLFSDVVTVDALNVHVSVSIMIVPVPTETVMLTAPANASGTFSVLCVDLHPTNSEC